MSNLLSLINLSKNFGSLQVIDNFNMHFDNGEALGIIGPNGAGPTKAHRKPRILMAKKKIFDAALHELGNPMPTCRITADA